MSINLIDSEKIPPYLAQFCDGNAEALSWLSACTLKSIKRREESAERIHTLPKDAPAWLANKWDVTGGEFHCLKPDSDLTDKVRHIADWIKSAKQNNALFLNDRTENGIPIKFTQLDLDSAYNAADKYFDKLNQKFRTVAVNDNGVEIVMTFSSTATPDSFRRPSETETWMPEQVRYGTKFIDGYRIVKILSTDQLKQEGAQMGHCVGGGSYDAKLTSGTHAFYSLRDPHNKSHATFEVEIATNALIQCKGKENKTPVDKYMPMVVAFIQSQQFEITESPQYCGIVKYNNSYYPLNDLPNGMVWKENLDLRYCTSLTRLPDHLSVGGGLYLSGCTSLTHLPDNLSVGETLNLWDCTNLTRLPENLTVGETLNLSGCTNLTHLPDNLSVGKILNLWGCKNLKEIPRTIKVKGYICTDLGTFKTVSAAADAFDKHYGRTVPTRPQKFSMKFSF